MRLNDSAPSADRAGVSLHDILSQAVDLGASDVHLKFGQPPVIRIDGDLAPLEGHGLFTSEALEDILNTVGASAPRRVRVFQETGEMDTAYQLPDLPRFRVNAFRQRGDISFAFRVIPGADPGLPRPRPPAGCREAVRGASRPRARHGRHG